MPCLRPFPTSSLLPRIAPLLLPPVRCPADACKSFHGGLNKRLVCAVPAPVPVPMANEPVDRFSPAEAVPVEDSVVQYVVIRKDLVEALKWPLGSIVSQGCHAAVAAIWLHKEDAQTLEYCASENLDSMHTALAQALMKLCWEQVTLEVKGDAQLQNLSKKLEAAGIAYKLWIEQPENIATCLATKPYRKSQVAQFFKKLKLCK